MQPNSNPKKQNKMAKINGLFGAMTGKLADVVMSVSRGQQVVRKYQPNVANPSTSLQVAQRAKMKLASQLAAALDLELKPYGRNGLVSSRNLFIRDLFSRNAISFADGKAVVDRTQIRLTSSRKEILTSVSAEATSGGATITGSVVPDYRDSIMGIRVVAISPRTVTRDDLDIAVIASETVVPSNGSFSVSMVFNKTYATTIVVYAYYPESEAAVIAYQNLVASGETTEVSLEVIRKTLASGLGYSTSYNMTVAAA